MHSKSRGTIDCIGVLWCQLFFSSCVMQSASVNDCTLSEATHNKYNSQVFLKSHTVGGKMQILQIVSGL